MEQLRVERRNSACARIGARVVKPPQNLRQVCRGSHQVPLPGVRGNPVPSPQRDAGSCGIHHTAMFGALKASETMKKLMLRDNPEKCKHNAKNDPNLGSDKENVAGDGFRDDQESARGCSQTYRQYIMVADNRICK
jgi:hypothetical protein